MASEKLQEIKTLFAQKLGMKTVDETKSLKDLGLDSLDVVELSFDLEDRYGISLDPEKLSTIKTVADLYAEIEKNEQRWETYNMEGAEFVIAAYGTVARICKAAIDDLKAEGINVGLVRPITLWPFPKAAVRDAVMQEGVKACLTVELSAGQMVEDVRLAVNGDKPVEFFGHCGSLMPTAEEVKAEIKRMREE